MKLTHLFHVALILLGTREVYGEDEDEEKDKWVEVEPIDMCGNVWNSGPPCELDPNLGDCGADSNVLTGPVTKWQNNDLSQCKTFTYMADEITCHPSCKSCWHEFGGRSWPNGSAYLGGENGCMGCSDSTAELAFVTDDWDDISYGYCKASSCATGLAALETCLAENTDLCPTSMEHLQKGRIVKPGNAYFNWAGGITLEGWNEVEGGIDTHTLGSTFSDVRYRICTPIIGLMEGFTFSEGTHHDCPCSPQVYEYMRCLNPDTIAFLDIQGVTYDGKSLQDALPATSSNPREEVCSFYGRPECSAVDIPVLFGPDAKGCMDNNCNMLPDCECNKDCMTCGWWDSLDVVNYKDNKPSKGAGDPGTQCTSCKSGKKLTSGWGGSKGSGHCWYKAAAPTNHKTFNGAIISMVVFLFALY